MSDHGHGHAPSHAPEPAHHAPEPSHHAESHGGDSSEGGEGLLEICSSFFCGLINMITGAVSDTVNAVLECNLVGELLDGGGSGGGGGGEDHGHGH